MLYWNECKGINKFMKTQIRLGIVLLFLAFGVGKSLAQINVSFPVISGSPGQTITVPISITGVESSTGFNSVSFDVVSSSPALVFKGAFKTASLLQHSEWSFASNAVANGGPNNRVAAFGSSQAKIATSGVLVFLQFQIVTVTPGVTVNLANFTLKLIAADVPFTPAIPTTGLNASNSPVATDDSYQVNEGATLTVTSVTGVLANDTDADGDPITATVETVPSNGTLTLNANGSFTYIHNGSETTTDSFTYSVSDGSTSDVGTVNITVVPVNDAPIFTQVMTDQVVDEGGLVSGDFNASDAEGNSYTFALVSGPAGAAVNATTGEFAFLATAGSSGIFSVVVSVTDGTATSQSSFTLTVRSVEKYSGTLSGIHQTSVAVTPATGSIAADYVTNTKEIIISGSFIGLKSSLLLAQVYVGSATEAGTGVLTLVPTHVGGNTSGNFAAASNTFDLDNVSFPTGVTLASFEQALVTGNVFVNLRTVDLLGGELRAQLRLLSNTAPPAINVSGPPSSMITGDPSATAYSLSWAAGAADAQGDATKLVLDASSDILFSNLVSSTDLSSNAAGPVDFTIDDAAKLYDALSGSTPGNVSIGGSQTVYYRLRRTDGSAISSGTPIAISLTRGLVTDTERDSSVPAEFVLLGNYPNPFNPSTTIQFDLPASADVQIDVLDLLGRTMISIPTQSFDAGSKKSVSVDASALSSGVYMYRVIARTAADTYVSTGTMTLIK